MGMHPGPSGVPFLSSALVNFLSALRVLQPGLEEEIGDCSVDRTPTPPSISFADRAAIQCYTDFRGIADVKKTGLLSRLCY